MTNEEWQEIIRKNVAEHTVLSPAHIKNEKGEKAEKMTEGELMALIDNEKCKSCEYFHVNHGEVSPEIKHYCFFASECLNP